MVSIKKNRKILIVEKSIHDFELLKMGNLRQNGFQIKSQSILTTLSSETISFCVLVSSSWEELVPLIRVPFLSDSFIIRRDEPPAIVPKNAPYSTEKWNITVKKWIYAVLRKKSLEKITINNVPPVPIPFSPCLQLYKAPHWAPAATYSNMEDCPLYTEIIVTIPLQ